MTSSASIKQERSKRIVVELTNRCNLTCGHCFSGRHGGSTDLSLDLLRTVLPEARSHGFTEVSYTGGDPTVHPRFGEALQIAHDAGFACAFVTNGWNFQTIFPRLSKYRKAISFITFSMDGATEATHDDLRGEHSYRRLMQAIAMCFAHKQPFGINMTITRHNRHELRQAADMAANLGAKAINFAHLMPNFQTAVRGADLSPDERKQVDAEIHEIRRSARIRVLTAPGYYTTDIAPCAPLNLEEINIDVDGNLTKCCHLSSHGEGISKQDVIGDLNVESFADAYSRLVDQNRELMEFKRNRLKSGLMQDTEFFTCWTCSLYFGKVEWIKKVNGPWSSFARESTIAPTTADSQPSSVSATRN